ncbi:hypothetical protein [Flavobacterium sp.]|uniref:hypothetical protein n=1 Tax=Flavobacterium sp. TaxID=239 RepID=UPI001207CCFA|nr:hypothetical protein [Flavobacterium sp.]RZJ73504.1 MAG: hypothetical protein EOO49_01435 [Flavobacterium sp.]
MSHEKALAMKSEKLLNSLADASPKISGGEFENEQEKVLLKRKLYLRNLMNTNRMCLKNNNINTLLLF